MARTREEYLKAKREGMARLRARDPSAARQKQKDWCDRNRDYVRTKVREYHHRRFFWKIARRLSGEDAATARDLRSIWKKQKGICALTGERLTRANAEVDHILPKKRGGNDVLSNLRWVTHTANFAKRDLTDSEFLALCTNVMRWIGERIAAVEALQ